MNKFSVLLGFALGLLPSSVFAQVIDPCPLGILPCTGAAGDVFIAGVLVNGAKYAFGGILFLMFVYFGFRLILGADNDSTVSETFAAYAHAAFGTILAGGAFMIADTFTVPGTIANAAPANSVILGVINVFRAILFAALVFNIFYQGFRLVTSQDDSQADKAKKQFIYGMVGAAIVILADRLVTAFWNIDSGILSLEAVGIANFLGTILGAFAVIALFVAGLFLILAIDESNKEKAKKIIIGALITLAVVMASLAIIRTIGEAPFTGTP